MATQIEQATHLNADNLRQIWGEQWSELAENGRLTQVVLASRPRGADRYDIMSSRWSSRDPKWSSVQDVHQTAERMFLGYISPKSKRDQVSLPSGLNHLEEIPEKPGETVNWELYRSYMRQLEWIFQAAIYPNGLKADPALQLVLRKGGVR